MYKVYIRIRQYKSFIMLLSNWFSAHITKAIRRATKTTLYRKHFVFRKVSPLSNLYVKYPSVLIPRNIESNFSLKSSFSRFLRLNTRKKVKKIGHIPRTTKSMMLTTELIVLAFVSNERPLIARKKSAVWLSFRLD